MTEAPIRPRRASQRWMARAAAVAHGRLWWLRAVTLGVRAIVIDEAGWVLLVRHTYTPGWYLPGGGVDRGESAEDAVIREVLEEAGILCLERPALHGLYHNARVRRDHVACYVIRRFEHAAPATPDWEIAESGFFKPDALPAGTTAATRRRLAEVLDGAPIGEDW
ncbi:NUDIX domain-containing protein [Beijerinckia sp. L45]|uniref:NUDIX domain-containing protein n=1 Tax=Beijerinckia sp. L45 TaxID=1641855 RepID=UPI00131D8C6E|nr:NUDIX domain-containing protein [Beijerinckia sp. L45]